MNKRVGICIIVSIYALFLSSCQARMREENTPEGPIKEEESSPIEEGTASEALPSPPLALGDDLADEGCTYNAYRMGWVLDWADAGNIVDTVFGPGSDFQETLWELAYPDQVELFEDITYRAYRETNFEERAKLWQQAERIIVEDVLMVLPLHYFERITLINPDVTFILPPFGVLRAADWHSKSAETTLKLPLKEDPITLDTTMCGGVMCASVIEQLTDPPYKFVADGSIEPLGATGFEVNDDGTIYTVYLREDAVWSDGIPVLAQHYVDGVLRMLDPEMGNAYAYVLMGIEGAAEFASGEVSTLESIQAIDDYTFQFRLTDPLSYFDSLLAFSVFHPIRLDVIESNPDTFTQPGVLVSNGAYILTEYVLGSHLLLEKNPLYWDAENVSYERIEMPIIPESATCVAAFETGDIDVSYCGFPPEDLPRWVDRPEFVRGPWPGLIYLAFNLLGEHTNDLDFRKALVYSVDKRVWNDIVLETPWKVEAQGVIPPEIYGHQGDQVGFGYDPEKAREHLERYMARVGINDPGEIIIELWLHGGEAYYETVQVMWEETLGIKVRLIVMEWETYLNTLTTCKAMAFGK